MADSSTLNDPEDGEKRAEINPAPGASQNRSAALAVLEDMANEIDGLVYACDKRYRLVYANRRLTDRARGNPVGQLCHEAVFNRSDPCPFCPKNGIESGDVVRRTVDHPALGDYRCLSAFPVPAEETGVLTRVSFTAKGRQAASDAEPDTRHSRFGSLIAKNADAIIVVEKDERIGFANPAAGRLFDMPLSDFIGRPFGIPVVVNEIALLDVPDRSGAVRVAEMRVVPTDWEGAPAHVATLRDVTARIRLEDQLRQAQKMEAIGTLAGGIAHDFNNILFPIIGYTEMTLEDIEPGSEAERNLREVVNAAKRAKDLVGQILAFSRQTEQDHRPLMIQPVLKEAVKLLRASLPTTIEIRQKVDAQCGTILGDLTQIHQVIMNLATNAFHAMRETGGILEVRLEEKTISSHDVVGQVVLEPGRYVRLSLSDTGTGIEPAILERIFEPYFTTKGKGEGTGLGLSVVHGIVTSHGGRTAIYSSPGEGTTFHVYFPRIDSGPAEIDPDGGEIIPLGNERVLLVDDEEQMVRMVDQMLTRLGYRVTARTESAEALEIFRAQPDAFDLVITDMTMPVMTGAELSRDILSIRPGMPIILCTGFSEVITGEKARNIGISEFVMKPVIMKELARTIRKVLEEGPRI